MAASPAGSVVSAGLEDSPSGKSQRPAARGVPPPSFFGMLGVFHRGPSLGCLGFPMVVLVQDA